MLFLRAKYLLHPYGGFSKFGHSYEAEIDRYFLIEQSVEAANYNKVLNHNALNIAP